MWDSVTSQKLLNECDGQSHTTTYALQLSIKSCCLLKGFLDRSLCCSTPLFCGNSFPEFSSWPKDIRVNTFLVWLGKHIVHIQTASNDASVIDRRWHTVLSMLVSINRVHTCLLYCHKSKRSTPKVITGH